MYIYVLEKFKNIHNITEIYNKDTIDNISEDRYKEIIKNMKKKNKNLIRKATKEEIADYLKKNNLIDKKKKDSDKND